MGNHHTAPTITVTQEERTVLASYVRRKKTAQTLATRARIILRCSEGGRDGIVAEELGDCRGAVGRWRRRSFARRGFTRSLDLLAVSYGHVAYTSLVASKSARDRARDGALAVS